MRNKAFLFVLGLTLSMLVGCPNSPVAPIEEIKPGNLGAPCFTNQTCNSGMRCQDNKCIPALDAGQAIGCSSYTDCDDQNPCNGTESCDFTSGNCVPGTALVCDDQNACNGIEACDEETGACLAGTTMNCSDGNECNGLETCNPQNGQCEAGTLRQCDDLNPCNGVETCDEDTGSCLTGTARVCDDSNACNGLETCDPNTGGCIQGTAVMCNDNDPCNGLERCNAQTGSCEAGPAIDCQDGDPCNGSEKCDPNSGACVGGEPLNCDDGEHCNGHETCISAQGGCVAGTPILCDDNNPCNGLETCVSETGVCLGGTSVIYDDGDPCNGLETCDPETGLEKIGTPLICEDDDPCTINECGTYGCISYPSTEPGCCNANSDCDDNDPCNGTEVCETGTGVCQTGSPLECNDGDACTFDNICIPGQGCVFAEKCYDQDPCTIDTCDDSTGECTFAPRCDDGIYCTLDICDEESGLCQNELVTTAHPLCDDNNKCTLDICDLSSDTCSNTAIDCSARDACEHDGQCNLSSGLCEWEPLDCYAELDVSPDDQCIQVACNIYQSQTTSLGCFTTVGILDFPSNTSEGFCEDDNPCTFDGCDSEAGCTHTPYETPPVNACNDSNACTHDGCSTEGHCENTPLIIDDNDACTLDTCDPANGAIAHNPKPCQDENSCSFTGCDNGTCSFIYPDRSSGECCDGKFYNYTNTLTQESDLDNYTFCHTAGGDTKWHLTNNWSSSSGGALYFGNAATFDFIHTLNEGAAVSGTVITEPILLPNESEIQLEFETIMALGTEPFLGDFQVAITNSSTIACDTSFTTLWTAPSNHQLGGGFSTVTVDLSDYAGQSISLRFSIDTAMHSTENGVGLLIDDILITSNCPADPCGEDSDCDDGRLCTTDSCGTNNGCVFMPIVCDDGEVCTHSFCDGFTGECTHDEVICEWDNECINAYCGDEGQCVYDIVQISDDDLCNGHEYCNLATGEHDSTEPITCDWLSPCWGGNTCNPASGQCERGDAIDCNAILGIAPDSDHDGDDSDDDGSACHGESSCQLSTGECYANTGHPLPLESDFHCPKAPEQCDDKPFQDGLGDAPSGYFKETDESGFFLKDQNIWAAHQNMIDDIYASSGVSHPSKEVAIGNSNRQAVGSEAWLAGRPLCLEQGFSFDWDDFSTIRGWWPQGVSGTGDAYTSGKLNDKEFLAVSSYHKAAEGDYNVAPSGSLSTGNKDSCEPGLEDPDVDACTKGARISFFDLSDEDDVEYRHMLLVTPTYDSDGNSSLKKVASHAGGIVWYRNWLYVPQTGSGFRLFDLNQIIELPTDKDSNFIGRNSDGQLSAFNYRYVIPEVARYYTCPTCCCVRFSYVSLINDNTYPRLVSGEFADDGRKSGRFFQWHLDAETGLLKEAGYTGLVDAEGVAFSNLKGLQGVAWQDARYWATSNFDESSFNHTGWLYSGRTSPSGVSEIVAHSTIGGVEDLYYNPHTDLLWTAGEFPGHRYMAGMDMSYLESWEPCGCSLSATPCLIEEGYDDLIEDIEELGHDISEWGGWPWNW